MDDSFSVLLMSGDTRGSALGRWGAWASIVGLLIVAIPLGLALGYPAGLLVGLGVAMIASFAWAISLRLRLHAAGPPVSHLEPDRKLFNEFVALLPTGDGVISFLRNHPWSSSFRFHQLFPLERYIDGWDDAMHVFHDSQLRSGERDLHQRALALHGLVVRHVFQRRDSALYRVYPEIDLDMEDDDTSWAFDAVRELSSSAHEFVQAHDAFVLLGRQRLGL